MNIQQTKHTCQDSGLESYAPIFAALLILPSPNQVTLFSPLLPTTSHDPFAYRHHSCKNRTLALISYSAAPCKMTVPAHKVCASYPGINFATSHRRMSPTAGSNASMLSQPKSQAQAPRVSLSLSKFIHNEAVKRINEPAADVTPKRLEPSRIMPPNSWARGTSCGRPWKTPKLTWEMAFSKPVSHPENGMEWTIPDDVFTKTQQDNPGAPSSFYSHSLYRGPGRLGPNSPVTVHYCRSTTTTERVCAQHFLNHPILGFDLEWMPNASKGDGPKHNVSLVQLATPSRIGLFHIAIFQEEKTADLIPPTLKKILENPDVIKCGVWILGDFSRLKEFFNLDPRGAIELSHYHNLITHCKLRNKGKVPKRGAKLADQVEQALGLPMYKGMDVRGSMWSDPLKLDQIRYSASDAYAGLQLFAVYEEERKKLRPCPPRPPLAELASSIETGEDDGISVDEETSLVEGKEGIVADSKGELDDKQISTLMRRTGATTSAAERPKRASDVMLDSILSGEPNEKVSRRGSKRSNPCLLQPQVAEATEWAEKFRSEHADLKPLARVSELRSYRLWITDKSLSIYSLAALLRDPPLLPQTVANYISNVVSQHSEAVPDGQGLPVDKERFVEVLRHAGPRRARNSILEFAGYTWMELNFHEWNHKPRWDEAVKESDAGASVESDSQLTSGAEPSGEGKGQQATKAENSTEHSNSAGP